MTSIERQKFEQAIVRGAELLVEHGIGDWTIGLQQRRKTVADCDIPTTTIRYSRHFIRLATREQFEGVTLHEIAHALLPAGSGHNAAFVEKCKEISPNDDYACTSLPIYMYKYTMRCPGCGLSGGVNKKKKKEKNRRDLCNRCMETHNKEVEFILEENIVTITLW